MNKDYRSQEPPCSSLSIHMEHAQDLEETDAPATHNAALSISLFLWFFFLANNKKQSKTVAIPDGRRGKHLAIGPYTEHNDWGNDHYQICQKGTRKKIRAAITSGSMKPFAEVKP